VARTREERVNLYQLLGVDPAADGTEVARAYRRRLRQLHPVVRHAAAADPERPDPPPDLAAVQQAYQVLRDPAARARYDAELRARAERRPAGRPVPVAVRLHRPDREEPLIRAGRVRVDPLPPRGSGGSVR
jgi:curved DNA-binding protein CbpA